MQSRDTAACLNGSVMSAEFVEAGNTFQQQEYATDAFQFERRSFEL